MTEVHQVRVVDLVVERSGHATQKGEKQPRQMGPMRLMGLMGIHWAAPAGKRKLLTPAANREP